MRTAIARDRRLHLRSRPVVLLAAGLLLVLAACSEADEAGGGDSFTVAVPTGFVDHLTPGAGGDSFVDHALFTPLTTIDQESGEVEMAVAESVESEDQKVWTIEIADGWTFHDGSPVTAQSFADAWNAAAYGPNGWIGNSQFAIVQGYDALNPLDGEPTAKEMSGVEVTGELSLSVTLTEPNALFPYLLSATTWAPMPEAAFDDLDGFDRNPVGNGPFRVEGEGLVTGAQSLSLVRYDDYAGEPARTRLVEVQIFQDSNAAYTSFQAGEVGLTLVDGTNLSDARERYPDQLVDVSFPAVIYLGFPLWDQRFADERVRTAIASAIDREAIADSLLRDTADPADQLGPDLLVGSEGAPCEACVFEPDTARDLLDESGWSGDLTLWTYEDPTTTTVLGAIRNGLAEDLGIDEVTTKSQPVGQLYTNLAEQKIDGPFLLYTGVGYPHLYSIADALFTPGAFNTTGFQSEEVESSLVEAAADPDASVAATQQAVAAALAEVPLTPVIFPRGGLVHAVGMSGIEAEILGGPRLASVSAD